MNYYDKDPKKGGKKIPAYKFFVQSGLTEKAIAEGGLINPTHDFNLLKAARLSLFEKHKLQFIDERTFNEVATTDQDLNQYYIAWLNNELDVIKQWLSDKYPTGKPRLKPDISNQIEIKKYWHFVVNEIETTELKVKTTVIQLDEHTTTVLKALNEYGFSKYLSDNKYDENKVYSLMSKQEKKSFMPYCIALLSEIEYLKYFRKEYAKSQTELNKKLAAVFDVTDRRIRGNINVLNAGTSEDELQYTSSTHIVSIRKEMLGLR